MITTLLSVLAFLLGLWLFLKVGLACLVLLLTIPIALIALFIEFIIGIG